VFPELAARASSIPSESWQEIEQLARQLADHALLPLVGAGASIDCGEKTASGLATDLFMKIADGEIPIARRPTDLDDDAVKEDLGKVADAICLEHPPQTVLEALAFPDTARWPAAPSLEWPRSA
jgi:hypothetical protein